MKKNVLGALAVSCALAAGMSMPAFADEPVTNGSGTSPVFVTLSDKPATLEFTVPTSIPFSITDVTVGQICSNGHTLPHGEIEIVNNNPAVPIKMTGIQLVPSAYNEEFKEFSIAHLESGDTTGLTTDTLAFMLKILNDSGDNVVPSVYPHMPSYDAPVPAASFLEQAGSYNDFSANGGFITNNAFYLDVTSPEVYIADASGASKINNTPSNYFNFIFTLSL